MAERALERLGAEGLAVDEEAPVWVDTGPLTVSRAVSSTLSAVSWVGGM